jgi:hypothetical protein
MRLLGPIMSAPRRDSTGPATCDHRRTYRAAILGKSAAVLGYLFAAEAGIF